MNTTAFHREIVFYAKTLRGTITEKKAIGNNMQIVNAI